jgi:hypothetical protein
MKQRRIRVLQEDPHASIIYSYNEGTVSTAIRGSVQTDWRQLHAYLGTSSLRYSVHLDPARWRARFYAFIGNVVLGVASYIQYSAPASSCIYLFGCHRYLDP